MGDPYLPPKPPPAKPKHWLDHSKEQLETRKKLAAKKGQQAKNIALSLKKAKFL